MKKTYWTVALLVLLFALPAKALRMSGHNKNAIEGGFGFQAGLTDWSPGGFEWFNGYSRRLGRMLWLNFQANLVGGNRGRHHCWRIDGEVRCDFDRWDGNAFEFVAGVKLRWALRNLPLVVDANLGGAGVILTLGSDYIGISPAFRGGVSAYFFLLDDFGVGPGINMDFGPAFIADGPGVEFFCILDLQVLGVEYRF